MNDKFVEEFEILISFFSWNWLRLLEYEKLGKFCYYLLKMKVVILEYISLNVLSEGLWIYLV